MLNLPNAVESFLDVADKHQHGKQHEYKAYSKKYAALGVYKIRVDKPDNGFCRLWLARQSIPKPHLDILGKTEPTSNGEHHGHDGYDGQNFTHENVQVLTNFMQELMPTTKELDTIYKKQKIK